MTDQKTISDIKVNALGEILEIPACIVQLSPMLTAATSAHLNHGTPLNLPYSAEEIKGMIKKYAPPIGDYLQLPSEEGVLEMFKGIVFKTGTALRVTLESKELDICKYACTSDGSDESDITYIRYRGIIAIMKKSGKIQTRKIRYKHFFLADSVPAMAGPEYEFKDLILALVTKCIEDSMK